MTAFDLQVADGKPLEIVDFKVDLLKSPPQIKEEVIRRVDDYLSTKDDAMRIVYSDIPLDEGRLNVYVCKFETGKCKVHIHGKIRGQELRTEKEFPESSSNSPSRVNERIKYILVNSRNILKMYYQNSNVKSIENHLMAFLIAA